MTENRANSFLSDRLLGDKEDMVVLIYYSHKPNYVILLLGRAIFDGPRILSEEYPMFHNPAGPFTLKVPRRHSIRSLLVLAQAPLAPLLPPRRSADYPPAWRPPQRGIAAPPPRAANVLLRP